MLDENYQVSKSKELLILSDLHLAIGELKIFDTYLSKIDTESLGKIEKSYEFRNGLPKSCSCCGLHFTMDGSCTSIFTFDS